MADNNNKNSGTVHYEMTQADYDLLASYAKQSPELQQMLARVRVVKDNSPVAPVKPVEPTNPVVSAESDVAPVVAKSTEKEQLTDEVLRRLFGANYNHVCTYDNEKQMLLPQKYNGAYVSWKSSDIANSKILKRWFENAFPKFELVAQATMQVSESDYPGWGKWSNGPVKFNQTGNSIVCNLIIRNKKTGKLELLKSGSWFGAWVAVDPYSAAGEIAFLFTLTVVVHSLFRWALFDGRGQR